MVEQGQAHNATQSSGVRAAHRWTMVFTSIQLRKHQHARIQQHERYISVRKMENLTFLYLHQLPLRREDSDGAVIHSSLGGAEGQGHHQNS